MIKLKLSQALVTLFFCGYFGYLYLVGKIGYYINPKYYYPILFAIIVSSVFGCIALWYVATGYSQLRKKPSIGDYLATVLSITLFISLFVIPIKPLTSSSVSFTTTPRIFSNSKNTTNLVELSSQTVSNLTIKDWLIAFKSSSKPQSFAGQKIKLLGFVSENNPSNNSYKLGRFQVSCCLSDAQFYFIPITIPSAMPNKDEWLELEGVFDVKEGKLSIRQESYKVVPTPANPYF